MEKISGVSTSRKLLNFIHGDTACKTQAYMKNGQRPGFKR